MNGGGSIGGFRLLQRLHGNGRQGAVWLGECVDAALPGLSPGMKAAVKVMPADFDEDGAAFARMSSVAAALSGLDRPDVVKYYGLLRASDAGRPVYILATEYLEGSTLEEWIASSRCGMDADWALPAFDSVLAGLSAVHAAGIVHRDIKPGNIFVRTDGGIALIDFETAVPHGTGESGQFAGTFDYMAPEFREASFAGDFRSDVFAAGVVLNKMLTGRLPYAARKSGASPEFAFMERWSSDGAVSVDSAALDAMLDGACPVILRALAPDPLDRFQSAAEFRSALHGVKFREYSRGRTRYRMLKTVGRGGFGEVCKAKRLEDGKIVAVKRLLRPEYGDRFKREARTMERFDDPHFVRLLDFFEMSAASGVQSFLVMDFLPGMPGSSLRDAMTRARRGPLPRKDVLRAFACYAHGLSILHAKHVYHRDIKPSNLYYPEKDPDGCKIMDFGIVRDADGTVTTDSVPGTLDYMPPEIVSGSERGDSRMDIYALGLCLYESLTGKSGYGRLPTGKRGVEAFIRRSAAREPPDFSALSAPGDAAVLKLLRGMTEPDAALRISSAAEVERRLIEIEEAEDACAFRRGTVPAAVVQPAPARNGGIAPERRHAGRRVPAQRIPAPHGRTPPSGPFAPARRAARPKAAFPARTAAFCAAGLLCFVAVLFLRDPAVSAWRSFKNWREESALKKAAEEAELLAAESDRNRNSATNEACNIVLHYGELSGYGEAFDAALAACDRKRDAWLAEWGGGGKPGVEAAVAGDFEKKIEAARDGALKRAREARERAEAEARKELEKRNTANRKAEEDRKRKIEERKERRNKILAKALEARAGIDAVVALYSGHGPARRADAGLAQWRAAWEKYLDEPEFAALAGEAASAKKAREARDREDAVETACRNELDAIRRISARESVARWRSHLKAAETIAETNFKKGVLSAPRYEELKRAIDEAGRWTVCCVANRTDRPVWLLGREIRPISKTFKAEVIVFTNAIPDVVAFTSPGCEPCRMLREKIDGRDDVSIMPESMPKSPVKCKVSIPALEDGVTCCINGISYGGGETAEVRSGQWIAEYSKAGEEGRWERVKEPFEVVPESAAVLRGPGSFSETREYAARMKSAEARRRGEALRVECLRLMEDMPLETRRKRLESVHAIIDSRINREAFAAVSAECRGELEKRYGECIRRAAGWIVNETDETLSVPCATSVGGVSGGKIAPGARAAAVFDCGLPADETDDGWWLARRVEAPGCEWAFLPADFDGREFSVSQDMIPPIPVKASVPALEDGVSCAIDGVETASGGFAETVPGAAHRCVYRRAGFKDVEIEFVPERGRDFMLPGPGKWMESGIGDGISSAFASTASAVAKGSRAAIDALPDRPEERAKRRLRERAVELRRRYSGGGKNGRAE